MVGKKELKQGQEVILQFGEKAEPRTAIVIQHWGAIVKLLVSYNDNGVEKSIDGWYKRKHIQTK